MIIWLPMLIPVVSAGILFFIFQHKTTWWEYLIPTGASLVLVVSTKFLVEKCQTDDVEYWTGNIENVQYYEEWTEVYITTSTDSKGRTHTETHYLYHPAEYFIIDNNNCRIDINHSTFNHFCQKFNNKNFQNLTHFNQCSFGDGNKYYTIWDHNEKTFTPCTSVHKYTNRIQASDSVFKFQEVSEEDKKNYGLYDYPGINNYYQCPSVLGFNDNGLLTYWNAKLGHDKQIRIWILNFKSQPSIAAQLQEACWQGGNKNDLVICIGDSWSYVFSWSESHELKQEIRDYAINHKLDDVINFTVEKVKTKWKRKEFADFNYLTVEPPIWTIVVTFILTGFVNGGVCYWVIKNEFNNMQTTSRRPY